MKSLGILVVSCLMLATLSGCATATAVTEQNRKKINAEIHGRSVAIEIPDASGFEAKSTESVLGTGVMFIPGVNVVAASAIGYSRGSSILKENNIENPAIEVSRPLAARLIQKYTLKQVSDTDGASADLAFSVRVAHWYTIYFLSDMNNYKTSILFHARLYDRKTGKSIIEGGCAYNPQYEDKDDAPKWDYLFENGAIGFKQEIKNAQSQCIDELAQKVFGL